MEMSMERRKTCGKSEMDGREKQCIGNNLGRILKVLGKLLQSTQCKRAEEGEWLRMTTRMHFSCQTLSTHHIL